MMKYQKFCYWIDCHDLKKIEEAIKQRDAVLEREARIPCRALRSSKEIVLLPPQAWEGFCKRRTSWYRSSDKAGKFLLVSQVPLDHLQIDSPILIQGSTFKPERLPTYEEIFLLVQSHHYQHLKPEIWERTDEMDQEFYRRWFQRYRPSEPFDFKKIFTYHSANHANFIDPKFSIVVNGEIAPYSISNSLHVCSSCIEFFNILGEQWSVKYVVPCIGAVQFAHLPMDQYFKVIGPNRSNPGQIE